MDPRSKQDALRCEPIKSEVIYADDELVAAAADEVDQVNKYLK